MKDSVKENDDSSKPNFETLRKAAEETSEEEKTGDDTEIEVLEDGLSNTRTRKQKKREKQQKPEKPGKTGMQQKKAGKSDQKGREQPVKPSRQESKKADNQELAEKLDRIIEQNNRMIEILESFGN